MVTFKHRKLVEHMDSTITSNCQSFSNQNHIKFLQELDGRPQPESMTSMRLITDHPCSRAALDLKYLTWPLDRHRKTPGFNSLFGIWL